MPDIPKSLLRMVEQILTSLKKSPTHLAIIRTIIIGMPKLMLPVASIKITVRLIVILTTPPASKECTVVILAFYQVLILLIDFIAFTFYSCFLISKTMMMMMMMTTILLFLVFTAYHGKAGVFWGVKQQPVA